MNIESSPEIFWLTWTTLVVALLWLPYIADQIMQMGLLAALRNSDPQTVVRSPWSRRSAAAHQNAVENLVVFAPLCLAVVVSGAANEATATACMVYFWVRAAHYLVYSFGVPIVRTLLFAVGVGCQLSLAFALLGWA